MNGYMADTNILIRAIRQPHHPLVGILCAHIGKDLYLSPVTWAELVYGAYRSADPRHNLETAQKLVGSMPILPFDTAAAVHAGQIMADLARAGTPIGDRDVLIAAHARSLGLTMVTHNVREFSRVAGLHIEDWIAE